MLKYWVYILILFGLVACSKDNSYQIEGELTNLQNQTVYAIFEGNNEKVIDTVVCEKDGIFKIKQTTGDFNTATLFLNNKETRVILFLKKGKDIKVKGDISNPKLLQISGGSEINSDLSKMRKKSANLWKERNTLHKQIKEKEKSPIEEADLLAKLTNVNHRLEEEAITYIKENPNKEVSLALIYYFFVNPEDTRATDELLAIISPNLKDHFIYKDLVEYSARCKRTNIGEEAPKFNVKDINGNEFNLDSIDNKYTLLSFTPSWTKEVRPIGLHMIQIAKKYQEKDINMIMITLDDNTESLHNVLKKDSIKWNLVCDSAGQASALIDLYNVNELPLTYLIDKDKKILLKSDNNLEIKDALEELVN